MKSPGGNTLIKGQMGKNQISFDSDYEGFGRKIETVDSDGVKRKYSYDPANRLLSLKSAQGISEALNYDLNSRITKIITHHGTENFTYDSRGQLSTVINLDRPLGFHSPSLRSFGYDQNGNQVTDSILGNLNYLNDQILSVSGLGANYLPDASGQGQLAQTISSSKAEFFHQAVLKIFIDH